MKKAIQHFHLLKLMHCDIPITKNTRLMINPIITYNKFVEINDLAINGAGKYSGQKHI